MARFLLGFLDVLLGRSAPVILIIALAGSGCEPTLFAETTPDEENAARELDRALSLTPVLQAAGSSLPLDGGARAYARGKTWLKRGQPKKALAAVAAEDNVLLYDRLKLIEGQAYRALDRPYEAYEAYALALEHAQVRSVVRNALRGLVNVAGTLGDRSSQLAYLDALRSEDRAPERLDVQRIRLLAELGRTSEAADDAWALIESGSSGSIAEAAEGLLDELGMHTIDHELAKEMGRTNRAIARGSLRSAARALARVAERAGEDLDLEHWITLKRAQIAWRRGRGSEAERLLRHLEDEPSKPFRKEVLYKLGRYETRKSDYEAATRHFDELAEMFPSSREGRRARFLSAWFPYDTGDFATASERMASMSEHPDVEEEDRREALWLAGFSAYLAKDDPRARSLLERLAQEDVEPQEAARARYWMGRTLERSGQVDDALAEYEEALRIASLSYYGLLALERVASLGADHEFSALPEIPEAASFDTAIEILGPDRPIGIDRARALSRAGFRSQAFEELVAVGELFRNEGSLVGCSVVADLLKAAGSDNLAFRFSGGVINEGGPVHTSDPRALRVYAHAFPHRFEDIVTSAAKEFELDPLVIYSVIRTETRFDPRARSPVGARGLMQLMPFTARELGRKSKVARRHARRYRRPASNVWLGTSYVRSLLDRYDGQLVAAAGAYNAGPTAMDRWVFERAGSDLDEFVERIPYEETRRYVKRVLETYMVYRYMDGQPLPSMLQKIQSQPQEALAARP